MYEFTLDTTKGGFQAILEGFKTGDTNTRKISVRFMQGLIPYPLPVTGGELPGYTATLYIKGNTAEHYSECEVFTDHVEHTFLTSEIEAGISECEIKIVADGKILTSPKFKIIADVPIQSDSAIEATNTFSALSAALEKVLGAQYVNATAAKEDDTATITVTDNEGIAHVVKIYDGAEGKQGPKGAKGNKGDTGPQGEQGPKGEKGAQGDKGDKGEKGEPGTDGSPGKNGTDGISPTVSTDTVTGGTKVTISDKEGEHSFTVLNGADGAPGTNGTNGQDGSPGADGISPTVNVFSDNTGKVIVITDKDGTKTLRVNDGVSPTVEFNSVTGGTALKITDKDGAHSVVIYDGNTPEKGVDYWTEADKSEMIEAVLAALPNGNEVEY